MPKKDNEIKTSGVLKKKASMGYISGMKTSLHRNSSEDMADKLQTAKDKQIVNAFSKTASDTAFGMSTGGVDRTPLTYIDPLFDPIIMMFPKDNVRELNRRLRHYYTYNPYIRNIINLHSSYPLSDFDLKCVDPEIEKYYNDFKERKDLLNTMIMLATDRWLLGEGFLYGNWNDYDKEFETFNQYPPEDIEVKNTYMNTFVYLMKPNENIKKQLRSTDPIDQQVNQMLETEMPELVEKMRSGKPYIFDNKRFIHLADRPNKYTPRGLSPVLAAIKDLMYEDRLRMLQTTIVDRHSFPLKLFKIGSAEKGWVPPASKYKEFEQKLMQASSDPDFSIITHPFVNVEYVTGFDKVPNLLEQFEFCAKRYMVALFVNDTVLHGEMGPYASQAISLKVLMTKYMSFRETVATAMREKIFTLLAVARGHKIRKQCDLDHSVRTSHLGYDIPQIFWRRANLLNNRELMDMVNQLRGNGEIPFKYIADLFDWDVEGVRTALKEEEGTRTDKLWRDLRTKNAEKESIANQILDGTKTEDLKMEPPQEEVAGEEGGKVLKPIEEPSSLATMKSDMLGGGGGGGAAPAMPPMPETTPPAGEEAAPAGENKGGVPGLSEALKTPVGGGNAPGAPGPTI